MDYDVSAFPEGTLEREIIEGVAAYVGVKVEEALEDVYRTTNIRASVFVNYNIDVFAVVSLARLIRKSSDAFVKQGYLPLDEFI